MPVTPIGLRSSNDVSPSESVPLLNTTGGSVDHKGCEKALAVPGALPKSAAKGITPSGLRANPGLGQAVLDEDQRPKRSRMESQRQSPRVQVAKGMKVLEGSASQSMETQLGDGDMWLSRVQDLPPR